MEVNERLVMNFHREYHTENRSTYVFLYVRCIFNTKRYDPMGGKLSTKTKKAIKQKTPTAASQ